jgi:predicted Ser/Thr protein kinase
MDQSLQDSLRRFLSDESLRASALLSSGYQGSAYLYDQGGQKLVIKEAGGGFFTGWFHRIMLRREAHVYQLMGDIAGVPHLLGMLDDRYLVLEFIDSTSLKDDQHELPDKNAFYAVLRETISAFHAVNVAHGDLKRRDNILVTRDGKPVVIDFGTAVIRTGNLYDRLMFRLVRRFDNNAWIKLKYAGDYTAISAADLQWYRPTILETGFRKIQRFWRVISFRQLRKRRRARENKQ